MRNLSDALSRALRLTLCIASSMGVGLAFSTSAVALGESGDGGCCSVPPELTERAQTLEQSFRISDGDELARQSWAGQLCQFHPCEGEVTEDQARELLRDFVTREQRQQDLARADARRAEDLTRADRDRMVAWIGVIIAFGGLVVSVTAMRQSGRNERDIGRLEGQI